jgi:tetratricopeptide (TPR) repeat protein
MTLKRGYAYSLLALIVLAAAILFSPTAHYDFINLDDPYLVLNNPDLFRSLSWNALFAPVAGLYHPLTNLTYWLDVRLANGAPSAFHISNLILHLASCVALFAWLMEFSANAWFALVLTVAFAWHPTHVESVAWISERKDVLSVFWFWLSLWSFQKSLRESRWIVSAWICALLSLSAKPFAMILPLLFILIESFSRNADWRSIVKRRWRMLSAFAVPAAAVALSAVYAQSQVRKPSEVEWIDIPLNLISQFGFYLEKSLWPFRLQIIYKNDELAFHLLALGAAVFWLIVFSLGARFSKPFRRDLKFGLLFFTITLAPMLKLVPFGDLTLVADRYLYVSLLGLLWPIAGLAARALNRGLLWLVPVLAVSCFWFYGSWLRLPDWQNSETMWFSLLEAQPKSREAHEYLGRYYLGREKHQQAIAELKQGIVGSADNAFDQAFSLLRLGLKDKADEQLALAEQIKPNDPQVLNLRGSWFLENGDLENAERYFRRSLAVPSRLLTALVRAEALTNLGVLLYRRGELENCMKAENKALEALPGYAYALYNAGLCSWALKKSDDAVRFYQATLQKEPKFAMASNGLGIIALERGNLDEAIKYFADALKADPQLDIAKTNLKAAEARRAHQRSR